MEQVVDLSHVEDALDEIGRGGVTGRYVVQTTRVTPRRAAQAGKGSSPIRARTSGRRRGGTVFGG